MVRSVYALRIGLTSAGHEYRMWFRVKGEGMGGGAGLRDGDQQDADEAELRAAIQRVLESPARKKLVVAGPGTGKTTLFKKLLEGFEGAPQNRLVLTFINNLRKDLEAALSDRASVYTLHSYCLGLLHRVERLRIGLSEDFHCIPGLAHLIRRDWEFIRRTEAPHFVAMMRELQREEDIQFYIDRGSFYDCVDFDDCVYRVYRELGKGADALPEYQLVLIDEYQDFNALEVALVDLIAVKSPILIAGDDDQALYSQLRGASWSHIRSKHGTGEFTAFELPFCMRCPKVIVDAVNDVLTKAQASRNLVGRIAKPFKYFPPAKGHDSESYPSIALVWTSVQSKRLNYMGRFIARVVDNVPTEEVDAANAGAYPAVLVIVAKPYRPQIIAYLEEHGYTVDTKEQPSQRLERGVGLDLLRENPDANLGWRIVLDSEPDTFARRYVAVAAEADVDLVTALPEDFKSRVLEELAIPATVKEEHAGEGVAPMREGTPKVRVTSFEGSKGLSAQHVIIVGLHNGELPRDPKNVEDIEICKFLVGLTRTRKRCYLVFCSRFAGKPRTPSALLSWIQRPRYEPFKVNAEFWRRLDEGTESE
jgi:superfamily I DNA/RNA helicase